MPGLTTLHESDRDVLIFGPQCLTLNEESAEALRHNLTQNTNGVWAANVLCGLSQHWNDAASCLPILRYLGGDEILNELAEWIRTGSFRTASFPLPNILLTPVTVALHLCQYQDIFQNSYKDDPRLSGNKSVTLGLCTGLLSAAAMSCCESPAELQQHGAVAIRLAMLIGALVDSKDISLIGDARARSYSVVCDARATMASLDNILEEFPEAYVSVVQDENRVTLTTPRSMAGQLLVRLESAGFAAVELGLRGFFHWKGNEKLLQAALDFCKSHADFCFQEYSKIPKATEATKKSGSHPKEPLHSAILRAVLLEQSHWHMDFRDLQTSLLPGDIISLTCFGLERCVPNSLTRRPNVKFSQVSGFKQAFSKNREIDPSGESIAVVGMSCQLPGAADLDEFWSLLSTASSQHKEVPMHRFGFDTWWRVLEPSKKWYGNFLEDHDKFDEKFFKKSPREMASTDPQQRLMLQVAYQAVEQSGYLSSSEQDTNVGCYIGIGLGDYETNVACYPATAYTATGNLKAFAAGKISHYFGWTGPGLTIDTACSSSAVAIHTACRAIISGDCTAALAGGVNVMASPEWFQNLDAASFLSPTGQCKPFDARADGYCRGEAVGAVFLKKLSSALTDGDQIFGVIAGSAVFQNQNCTAITVPNVPSLSGLFEHVTARAGITPADVSYVEAHGTGTPVGDPAEFDSIRKIFGGAARNDILSVGSVKGLLGHSESASGVVALLKTLMMLNKQAIPPQASFKTINPALNLLESDKIKIENRLTSWDNSFKAALINNYGASGSNATLLVTQAPRRVTTPHFDASNRDSQHSRQYPILLSASDEGGLQRYVSRFLRFVRSNSQLSLADISFQLSRQSNPSLRHSASFLCDSVVKLEKHLVSLQNNTGTISGTALPPERPVILCFGGQILKHVGLDKDAYDNFMILRFYLDKCNTVCEAFGESIYPEIFQKQPLEDTVKLQLCLFSLQYACARSWMNCGTKIAAVVGHSFGELTALCISSVVALEDILGIICRRARIVRDSWGPKKGSMVAVKAEKRQVEDLLRHSTAASPGEPPVSIACFNGPKSFTLAGPEQAIDSLVNIVRNTRSSYVASVEVKRLEVTNAFHSSLVDSIKGELEALDKNMVYNKPLIHLERATENETKELPETGFFARHIREPVYFSQAVHRLSQRFPEAVWLEAGSNSTITTMASRALGSPENNHFQAVNITAEKSHELLADVTVNLWRKGLNVRFWPYHKIQASAHDPLLLPPYQFKKSSHWLELKKPQKVVVKAPSTLSATVPEGMWSFETDKGPQQRSIRFRIHTNSEKFTTVLKKHLIARKYPLCPSTLQADIVIDALMHIRPDFNDGTMQPQLSVMESHSPLCLDASRVTWLDVNATDADRCIWDWKIISQIAESAESASILHVSGRVTFYSASDPRTLEDFSKYERLVRRKRCHSLLENGQADELIQGRNIYRAFLDIVEYGDIFRGLQKLVGKRDESAGRVSAVHPSESWLDFSLGDSYCQVAGIFLNTMTEIPADEMYISDRIGQWIRSPRQQKSDTKPETLEVYACHHQPSPKEFLSDVFVFDPRDGTLREVVLGIHYTKVSKAGFGKMIARLAREVASKPSNAPAATFETHAHPIMSEKVEQMNNIHASPPATDIASDRSQQQAQHQDVAPQIKEIISNLSGLDTSEIKDDSGLAELGIDSLMGMELAREISNAFKCAPDTSDLYDLTDFQSLVHLVEKTLGVTSFKPKQKWAHSSAEALPVVPALLRTTNGHTPTQIFNSTTNGINNGFADSTLPADAVLEAFSCFKQMTDQYVMDNGLGEYCRTVLPKSDLLCITYICDAFEQLGCLIYTATPGQQLDRIQQYLPQHEQFINLLYYLLEKKAELIKTTGSRIVRTAVAAPSKPAHVILKDLLRDSPLSAPDHKLTALTSVKLADCLTGKSDGLQLIFGTQEGREIASAMYGQSPINVVWIKLLQDFLRSLVSGLPRTQEPLRILELGAGTGGTTAKIVPLLAELGYPVHYTVTDISASLVAGARNRFKQYPFMEYRVLDIENVTPPELLRTQHIVLATNCVHVTRNLSESTRNLRNLLRRDGFLIMLEMTETLPWIDIIFGLLEGWWLFNDGRKHALAPISHWEKVLLSAGFVHVDWTDGDLPESAIQRLILATASGPRYERNPAPSHEPAFQDTKTDSEAFKDRKAAIDSYVHDFTVNFSVPTPEDSRYKSTASVVLITGATGSLGSHLVQNICEFPDIQNVICLNRRSSLDPTTRQLEAFKSRGIKLSTEALAKLRVLQTDTSKVLLGLSEDEYDYLSHNVTHIVHNAWPMSISRTIHEFESQFRVMQNLIGLARDAYSNSVARQIVFQFISSIATVGLHPLRSGRALVPEDRMAVESVLPNGYGDAKLVCEHMLDETMHRHPYAFRPMAVRLGQIAGSRTSGYWNPREHFAFMIKSAQTLKMLPDLKGTLSWCPVNDVSACLTSLLTTSSSNHPIYHIENPTRQPWPKMIETLCESLGIPRAAVVPFNDWVASVRGFPGLVDPDNPAARLVDFLEQHYVRMSCGPLILDTAMSQAHSKSLRYVQPINKELVQKFIHEWKSMGFLS